MGYEAPKVLPNNNVPSRRELLVHVPLNLCCNILFYGVFLGCLDSDVYSILLQFVGHVDVFDDCFGRAGERVTSGARIRSCAKVGG